jgi:DNA-binding NarL/FixJ family response regulator
VAKEEGTRVKQALLIEDHALFREGLALLLKWRTGLECVEAGTLDEAHRVLSDPSGTSEVAIINVDLPDGDGCELIEELHKTKPGVPVLALTADKSLGRQAQALQAGADDVLAKATPIEQIIGAVRQLRRG